MPRPVGVWELTVYTHTDIGIQCVRSVDPSPAAPLETELGLEKRAVLLCIYSFFNFIKRYIYIYIYGLKGVCVL